MSSFLEMRSLTFDRAGAIIPVPDAFNGPLPKKDWSRSGTSVTVSPVALPRTLPQNSIGTHAVDFHIELPSMSAQSTGVFVVALTWQFGSAAAGWTTFDTTTHRVLVLA